jgi:hypothetical protein
MKVKSLLKYSILALAVLLLGIFGYFGISWYRSVKNPVQPVYSAIPASTAFFAEFVDPAQLIRRLADDSPFWEDLLSLKSVRSFQQQFLTLDSLLARNSQINTVIRSRKTVACVCNTDSIAGVLFLCELPSGGYENTVRSFIMQSNGDKSIVMQKKSGKSTISLVNITGIRKFFSYSVYEGLFIGSFQETLVRQAIARLDAGVPVNATENFKKLEITAGKNVDANLYVNYPQFSILISKLVNPATAEVLSNLNHFAEWSGMDLIVKPDEIFMNGYTVSSGSENSWLNLLEQEPQSVLVPEILPEDINVIVCLGMESFENYHAALEKLRDASGKDEAFDKQVKSLEKTLDIDIAKEFAYWTGHEIALAATAFPGSGVGTRYVVIRAADLIRAKESLNRMSDKTAVSSGETIFMEKFEDYEIRKLDVRNLFYVLFGELFRDTYCPYFTAIRDYVVFAETSEALIKMLGNFYEQKTLAETSSYQNYSSNVSDKSNLFVYCNLTKALTGFSKLLSDKLRGTELDDLSTFRNFEGLSFQFSHLGDMFYTSLYLRYNPVADVEIPSGWVTEISGNVYGKPCFTRNEETGKLNIVVFDDQNNIYMLDHLGRIEWKTPVIELPLSELFCIKKDGAGAVQYLFNTQNYMYLIDHSGNYVNGYPVKLAPAATNGVMVLDYDNDRNYRLLLGIADNRIYNFDLNMVPVEGWNKISLASKAAQPVEYLATKEKDFLVAADENGNIIITDRTGKTKISPKHGFQKARNAGIYLNQTNSKGLFLTTDENGKIVYIKENGKTDRTDFGNFSPDHFFLYEDFSQDGSKDFIFLDKNKLTVLDRFKKQIFSFEFPENITNVPVYFGGIRSTVTLGVVAAAEKKIYLFTKEGQAYSDYNFSGSSQFIAGSVNNDGKLNLITGSGNKVMNYVLE